jgi:ABC-2 type transport system permease protein
MRPLLHGATVQLRTVALTPLALVTSYLTPLSIAVLAIWRIGHPRVDLVVGSMAAAVVNALVVQTYFAAMEERYDGTMQVHAASPTGLLAPLIGRLLGALTQGLVALPLTVALVAAMWGPAALGKAFERQSMAVALAGLLMAIAGLFAMAMVHVAMVVRSIAYTGLVNAIFPVAIVAMGLFTPMDALPGPLRLIGYALPPTWAMEAVRDNAYGQLLGCGATALCWGAAGVWLLRELPSRLRNSPEGHAQ